MKTLSSYLCLIAMIALVFASCSKDEPVSQDDPDKATLSFGAIVNDLAKTSGNKQSTTDDLPQCTDDDPAYVEIVLSQGGTAVVGSTETPFRVDLVAGQVFTEEVPELELTPGTYSLDYFKVYNASGTLIWVAPKVGGDLADFIDNPLPLSINLGAGVKKYVDVSVLCFDDRNVNQYGYQFFDIDTNEAMEFCIFGNYCPPSGRHYPASFSVDVWMWEDGMKGTQLYSDLTNEVTVNEDGDYAGTPLCMPLPDKEGEDEFYVEITLLNSDAYSGDMDAADIGKVIEAGVLTEAEVKGLFDGENNLDYYHFRYGEGCTLGDMPPIFNEPGSDAQVYKACLDPMNDSGALAFAYFELDGNTLHTTVLASGLEPNTSHLQHIHGKEEGNSTCPPESVANEDGIITLSAGLPYYGAPILALTEEGGEPPMSNAGGNYIYERTFTLGEGGLISAADLGPLEDRAVVLHGLTIDGSYDETLPIACEEIEEQE